VTRKLYHGSIVEVSFDGAVCQHAGECVRGMPAVFDTEHKPWIDPMRADTPDLAAHLREVVGRCPSGALRIEEREATNE